MAMNDLDNRLINFSDRINRHGYAVKITAVKGGLHTNIQATYIPIDQLTNGTPFYLYLKEILKNFHVDQLIVMAKQRNGLHAYKNAKEFILDIPEESPLQTHHYPQVGAGLSGTHHNQPDPMSQVYLFQIEQLRNEVNALTPFKEKYELEREQRFDLERQLKTIEKEHELDRKIEEYDSKNSIGGVIKELQPTLTQALAGLAGAENQQVETLGAAPNALDKKTQFLIELISELGEEHSDNLLEIVTRLAFTTNAIPQVAKSLKDNTPQLDEKINEVKQQFQ